jgi:predicted GIY-YIG superfamily endonuclease
VPKRKTLQTEPTALYRYFDADGQLLYLGITCNLKSREQQHQQKSTWWPHAVRRTDEWLPDRAAAELAEARAVRAERPKHNLVHRSVQPREITPSSPGTYTTGEMAERFVLSRQMIRQLRRKPTFPEPLDTDGPRIQGQKVIRYDAAEVEAFFSYRIPLT